MCWSPRIGDQVGDDCSCVVSALTDGVRRHSTEGMLDDDHARVDHPAPRRLVAGEGYEGRRADEERDGASLFEFGEVVDTPRRTRTSIPRTGQDDVRGGGRRVE